MKTNRKLITFFNLIIIYFWILNIYGGVPVAPARVSVTISNETGVVLNTNETISFPNNVAAASFIGSAGSLTNFPLYVDAKTDFGATGDGSTDDTAALQGALDYCQSNAPFRLYLPAGTYKITSPLVLRTNSSSIEVFGDGASTSLALTRAERVGATIIQQVSATNGIQFISTNQMSDPTPMFLVRPYFHDFALLGPTNNARAGFLIGNTALYAYGCVEEALFERLWVGGFTNGFEIGDTVNMTIREVDALFNSDYGIKSIVRSDSLLVENCWLGGIWNAGSMATAVSFEGGGWATVRNCEVGNCGRALYVDGMVLTWEGGNLESFYGTEVMLTTNLNWLIVNNPRFSPTAGNDVPLIRMTAGEAQTAATVALLNPKHDGDETFVQLEGPFTDAPLILSSGNGAAPVWQKHSTVGGPVTQEYYGATIANTSWDLQEWSARPNFKANGSTMPALRIQNGWPYGSVECGADYNTNTLTANTLKWFTLTAPTYATDTYYQHAFLQARNFDGNNTVNIGGDAAGNCLGSTYIGFWTAPNASSIASQRWYMTPDGHFYAGTDDSYDIGANGASRPRNIYVSDGVYANSVTASSFIGSANSMTNFPSYRDAKTDFGATGNGTTDDTAALQAAIDYCQSNAPFKLYLPAGTYKITSPLVMRTNSSSIEIFGAGAGTSLELTQDRPVGATIIKQVSATNGIQFISTNQMSDPDPMFLIRPYFHDFALLGPTNEAQAGFLMGNTALNAYGCIQEALFERLWVGGFTNGFEIGDTVSTTIRGVDALFNSGHGIKSIVRSDSMLIENCWLGGLWNAGSMATAISFEGGGWSTVRNCEVGNCGRALFVNGMTLTWEGGNLENFNGTEIMLTTNLNWLLVSNPRYSPTTGNDIPIIRMTAGEEQGASTVTLINPKSDGTKAFIQVEGPFIDAPNIISAGNGANPVWQKHSTVGGAVTEEYYEPTMANTSWDLQTWSARPNFQADGSTMPALRIQNGWQYGSVECGADYNANTLTANTMKWFTLTAPTYATDTYYQHAFLQVRNYDGQNTLNIGGESAGGCIGSTYIGFWTAPNASSAASQRWYMTPDGHFYAGTDNSYDIGASGASRPRNIYAAGTVSADSVSVAGTISAENFVGSSSLTNLQSLNWKDIRDFGASTGDGATTTVSSWSSSTVAVLADASIFKEGQSIGIDRAGDTETTGTGSGATLTVASASGFSVDDRIIVAGGRAAQAMVRKYTVIVRGNIGDTFYVRLNNTNYSYTVIGGDTGNKVATNLAAAITGDAEITATVDTATVIITANTAGTEFSYENVRPTGRARLRAETTAANIVETDFYTKITDIDGTTFTVSPTIPSSVTDAVITQNAHRLLATITDIDGNTVTFTPAATTQVSGVTVWPDDQPAFLAAGTAARTNNGVVYVPPGIWTLANQETLYFTNVSLIGAGKGISTIQMPNATYVPKVWMNRYDSGTNLVVRDLTFDLLENPYSENGGYALSIGSSTAEIPIYGVNIDRIEVRNVANIGAYLYGISKLNVRDSWFHDIGDNGLSIGLPVPGSMADTRVFDINVSGNTFERIAWIGCNINGSSSDSYGLGRLTGVHISNNSFTHCALVGCEFYSGIFNSTISGNTFRYCGGSNTVFTPNASHGGIVIKRSQDIGISDNRIEWCYNGIELCGPSTNDLTQNFQITKNVVISGNSCMGSSRAGIDLSCRSEDLTVSRNHVDGTAVWAGGIHVGTDDTLLLEMKGITISDNLVKNAVGGIYVSSGVKDLQILHNTLENCNGNEESSAYRAAISINPYGGATYPVTNVVVTGNRIIDTRITPSYATYTLYTANCSNLLASVNYTNGVQAGPNINSTAGYVSSGNSWDAVGYYSAKPTLLWPTTAPTAAEIGGTVGSVTNYMIVNIGGILRAYWSDGSSVYNKDLAP